MKYTRHELKMVQAKPKKERQINFTAGFKLKISFVALGRDR
ncbi:hypothetical protein BC751_1937 [Cecembia calidifontis]|uniref:Uncharacterized protein n=1 Tax=Cecembia calidifontis TaxID=1187080 RepID=A0A4Q7P874_9BACT|nr:hypothetical protein BC751_1937 [Cecembia calidifontis]